MSKSYYQYDPSQVATLVACGLFSVNFLYAGFMTAKKRSWTWIVMLLGTLLECMGYGVRYKSAADIYNKNLYVFQFCTIVLAPVLMAAVVYVVFGRIVFHVVPPEARTTRLIWVTPRFITPIFVTFDVLALLMQLIGAVMVASVDPTEPNAADQLSRGRDIALSGLGVQLAAFGLFSVVAVRFHFTSRRFVEGLNARLGKVQGSDAVFVEGSRNFLNPKWRHLLYVVNASCVLIMIRSIYRVEEFAGGPDGPVKQAEWYMYVFDTLPMILVVVLFNVFFPGSYLPFMGFKLPKHAGRVTTPRDQDSITFPLRERGHPMQEQV